ncbi:predicted protein [Brucella abortus bv. 4 str. 292]|uniref:Prokaryotic diacylglycerol kinase n=4 Tax=Brucella TaxID=234 RepID=A9M5Z0_BRUC2|nr:conserved hypothetical protein [Brucella ovis ATCC 25840]ABX62395.1 Hypothetical protein, conserved [Brucella canis ATCC 23365]ACD72760.1 Prokaryotic diacylglycerol kinase [Brucella abortus S19]EEW79705.1 prokaryotic diacylglycerol kinase [Brucella abortus NCTC 8038]EEW90750.1 prokaryotic diacylglycerol kinase [Brucella suis bv. 4 str. 40]EEX55536.1 predicted protein [Brucella abortus bv. 4 str. 292]EEX59358.1 predicted protein [Brucella abortus bv. 2 str. 86/8/59]EEX61991.1 predicted pro
MLPAPEKILLTALQTAAPAFCDLFSIEFHRTPRPLKKGGNAQYCVHHIDSEQSQNSHPSKPPYSPIRPVCCSTSAAIMNDALILKASPRPCQ